MGASWPWLWKEALRPGFWVNAATDRRAWLSSVLVEYISGHALVSTESPATVLLHTGMAGWPASSDVILMAHVAMVQRPRVA